MKSAFAWVALAASCFVFSCASPYHEADRGVEGTLRSTITDRGVDIDVDRGVVTLEGKVNTEADRQRIEMLARRTPGVVAVKNKLKVNLPTPGDYGALPGSTTLRTAPPTAVITEPPAAGTEGPAIVAVPSPTGQVPSAILVPGTTTVRIQPATPNDQVAANRIAQELSRAPVVTSELDNVTITINSGTATINGVVDNESKREAILDSVKRVAGVTAIYDQLQVK